MRRLVDDGVAEDERGEDLERRFRDRKVPGRQRYHHAERLATLLLDIHSAPGSHGGAYTRAIRDLLGHGEGIFGLVDSYAPGPLTPRLRGIEEACLRWRWKLRERTERLRRTDRFARLPIVVVSTRERPEDKLRGLRAGADAYLAKQSLMAADLVETVRRLTGG